MNIFKENRTKLGLSMQDVADAVGCSKATICRLEQGRNTSYKTVNKIFLFFQNEINEST